METKEKTHGTRVNYYRCHAGLDITMLIFGAYFSHHCAVVRNNYSITRFLTITIIYFIILLQTAIVDWSLNNTLLICEHPKRRSVPIIKLRFFINFWSLGAPPDANMTTCGPGLVRILAAMAGLLQCLRRDGVRTIISCTGIKEDSRIRTFSRGFIWWQNAGLFIEKWK